MEEVAGTLTDAMGRKVVAIASTPEQAVARGLHPGWVRSQEWTNEVGYQADIAGLARWGVPLTSFAGWAGQRTLT